MAFDDLDRAEREEADSTDDGPDRTDRSTDDATAGKGEHRTDTTEGRDPPADTPGSARGSAVTEDDGPEGTDAAGTEAADADADPSAPAFDFEEAKQRPLYARRAAWDAFEDALAIEVEATLRRNDVRDTPKRELHDAALHVLAEHADEVADRVLAERGIER